MFPLNCIWWSRKSHQWATNTCALEIAPAQHKKEDLEESIGVVPTKYPPKVKLELLTTPEC